VVLTDSFDEGWQAFVGGSKAEVLRADFNLRALVVSKGQQEINFVYQPKSFKIGLYTSGGALILLLLLGLGCYRFKKDCW